MTETTHKTIICTNNKGEIQENMTVEILYD